MTLSVAAPPTNLRISQAFLRNRAIGFLRSSISGGSATGPMLLRASSDWMTVFLQASDQGLGSLGIIVFPQ